MLVYPDELYILFSTSDPEHLSVCHFLEHFKSGQSEQNKEIIVGVCTDQMQNKNMLPATTLHSISKRYGQWKIHLLIYHN